MRQVIDSLWTYHILFGAAGVLALVFLWRGLFHDRARGRPRCLRCGYDMQVTGGRACAECGWTARRPNDPLRTRRHARPTVIGLLLLTLTTHGLTGINVRQRIHASGEKWYVAIVPTSGYLLAWPALSEAQRDSAYRRVADGGAWQWQTALVADHLADTLKFTPARVNRSEFDRLVVLLKYTGPRDAALQPLLDAMREKDPVIQQQAALALVAYGPRAEPALTDIITRLGREWYGNDTLDAFAKLAVAIGPLAEARWTDWRDIYRGTAPDQDPYSVWNAARNVGPIMASLNRRRALDEFIDALPRSPVRELAEEHLRQYSRDAEDVRHVQTRLRDCLKHDDWTVRAAAVRLLARLHPVTDETIEAIAPLLMDTHSGPRIEAIAAILCLGRKHVDQAAELLPKYFDPSNGRASMFCDALYFYFHTGRVAEVAVKHVSDIAYGHSNAGIRQSALRIMTMTGYGT
ncbi:MAG: hypothetical protein WD768_19880 [Phycisphaeraceae bacterium]